ncbi:MAG: c-di-GMP-binding flagellar brake protein YcgR [Chlamydiales bacterium]|jgi:c-di-GMP-binding flagellar brake protein YcgR
MFFKRKKAAESPPAIPSARSKYRSEFGGPETILATVISPTGFAPEGIVSDLSIRGAGVLIPFEADPGMKAGDVLELVLRSPNDQWTVQTPIRLQRITQANEREVMLGCEFINMGNLYSQLENALGVYFNRRARIRVRPEIERKIIGQMQAGARRIRSPLYELSATGTGMTIQAYQRDWIEVGQSVEVSFQLPDVKKEISGPGHVRHLDPVGANLLVGIEFDIEDSKGIARHAKKLDEYIELRTTAMDRFADDWAESNGTPGLPSLDPPSSGVPGPRSRSW